LCSDNTRSYIRTWRTSFNFCEAIRFAYPFIREEKRLKIFIKSIKGPKRCQLYWCGVIPFFDLWMKKVDFWRGSSEMIVMGPGIQAKWVMNELIP